MATPIFPQALPGADRFTLRPEGSVVSDEDDGVKGFRRRSSMPHANGSVTWTFLETEMSAFAEFCRVTLLGFHKWFWLKLPSAGGITWHIVRFRDKPTQRMVGHSAWTVEANLELLVRAFEPQPDPPVAAEGEGPVLTLSINLGSGHDFDGTPVTTFDTVAVWVTADYASYDSGSGLISLTQPGVYEVTHAVRMLSNLFTGSHAPVIGSGVAVYAGTGEVQPTTLTRRVASEGNSGLGTTPREEVCFTDSFIVLNEAGTFSFNSSVLGHGYFAGDTWAGSMTVTVRRLGDFNA